ncbi:Gfo/Idh/MocA family protein [Croceicoccus mobilis]|uniref:Oxidoreductase n=1 Tax=Croceicoccus mobilis TaxID=1703339 RepID=A0A916Z7K2_9SPHN|nr:Gfo/Idh/MocA family oxidoreductase [Croceicoccus mobilis]GGD80314.1 oxidoreductase [Croceicoccus mobilis]
MAQKIGVGIIGVAPGRSWAAISHIPALRSLDDYEIVALSTTRMESARAAADEFGVDKAYDNHHDLVNDPAVDLVVVTVKVPHHRELVTAAIQAGKHVYCEWPLGNGLAEAEEMAALAEAKGVVAAVGMQARSAPVFRFLKDLIADGYVGEVLSLSLIGSGMNWGAAVDQPNAYTFDKANGATMLSIPFGHTMDALCQCVGEVKEVEAMLANRRTSAVLVPDNTPLDLTAEDQVLVNALFEGGAVGSIHYRGGVSRETNMLLEINGTEGDIVITGPGGHAQLFDLSISGGKGEDQAVAPMEVPAKYSWTAEAPALVQNVAQAYALLAGDIRSGTHDCPDFEEAVKRHRLLSAIEKSAASGTRTQV